MDLPELADPERALALIYAPRSARPALRALWAFDEALENLAASTRNPGIGAIRLAWWRERVPELATGAHPGEPVLRAMSDHFVPREPSPGDLEGLIDGWEAFLSGDADALSDYARARGRTWLTLSGRLLRESPDPPLLELSEAWALQSLARVASDEETRRSAAALARERFAHLPSVRWPRRLRPAGMVVALARLDAAAGSGADRRGAPKRVARMLGLALTGR